MASSGRTLDSCQPRSGGHPAWAVSFPAMTLACTAGSVSAGELVLELGEIARDHRHVETFEDRNASRSLSRAPEHVLGSKTGRKIPLLVAPCDQHIKRHARGQEQ